MSSDDADESSVSRAFQKVKRAMTPPSIDIEASGEVSTSEKSPGEILSQGDFVFDDASRFNGLSAADLTLDDSVARFTCVQRERVSGGFWYYVDHANDHDDLDYEGKFVVINDIPRMCSDFEINDDGTLALFCEDVNDAGKKG